MILAKKHGWHRGEGFILSHRAGEQTGSRAYKNHTALLAGQIKADGGDQQKFDDGMRALRKTGIQAESMRS